MEDTFQLPSPQWVPEMADSIKLCLYEVFPYTVMYRVMTFQSPMDCICDEVPQDYNGAEKFLSPSDTVAVMS